MIGIPDEEGYTTTLVVQDTKNWPAVEEHLREALQTGVYRIELKRAGRGIVTDRDVERRERWASARSS